MMALSGGISFLTNDGMNFSEQFGDKDLVITLHEPQLNIRGLDKNIRTVMTNLFQQDYGKTAHTLFQSPPPSLLVSHKKVPLRELCDRWNHHNQLYCQALRQSNIRVAGRGGSELVKVLEPKTNRGEEPWMYGQMMSVQELASALSFGGVVQTLESRGPHKQIMETTFAPVNVWTALNIRYDVFTTQAGGKLDGCDVYLVIYDTKCKGSDLEGLYGGTKLRVVVTSEGPLTMFNRILNQEFKGDGSSMPAGAYLPLGRLLGGEFFLPSGRSRWHFCDLMSTGVVPDPLPKKYVARDLQKPKALKRQYQDIRVGGAHPKVIKYSRVL